MPYEHSLSKPFIAPIFIEEDGYWQNCMKPYLEREGWYIAEVDCAGATGSLDFGRRFLTALDFDWDSFPYEFDVHWAFEYATEVDWLDLRQGLFVFYENFEDLFSVREECSPFYAPEYALQLAERMSYYYSDLRGYIYEEYPVVVGYGVGLPTSYIPQLEELMGAENVMIAGKGVRYPWSDFEEEQRRNFPNGAPDPLYDKTGQLFGGVINHDPQATGIYVADPRYYPESPFYDPELASKVHLVHSEDVDDTE